MKKRSKRTRREAARRTRPGAATIGVEHFVPFLLVTAALLGYHNALRGPFVMDDLDAIPNNETIRTLWPPWGALTPPAHTAVSDRPIANLSLAFNYALDGLNVASYHAFNVTVHTLCSLVLFGIVLRTLRSPILRERYRVGAVGIATSTALLWIVHPLTTESVDYTIQRTELVMGFFFLLTLYFAIRGLESPEGWGWPAATLAAFALGLGSKEVTAVAPFVVLAYDRLFGSPSFKETLRRRRFLYVGFAVILASYALVVERFRQAFGGSGTGNVTSWQYLLTQSGVIAHYLRLAVWPAPLAADYAGWPIATSAANVLPSLIAVGVLFILTVWGLVRNKKIAYLGVFFFLLLAPTSSLLPLPNEIAAERRMYLPLAAVVALIVLTGHALLRRLPAAPAAGRALVAVLAVVLALATVRRNEDYRTTLSFWTDIVAKRPDNPRARMWLGKYLFEHGKRNEAYEHLATAVHLEPKDGRAQYGLGVVLASQGRTDEAIERYRKSLRIDPGNASAHNNLGIVLAARGETDEAIEHYVAAIRIDPTHAGAHYNLAMILADRGRTDEAIGHLETALRLKPAFPEARQALDNLRKSAAR